MAFAGKARGEHMKDASLLLALALSENIILGMKSLPRTNTLAYYKNL